MQKVKGLGGIFIKTADRERLRQWYASHLGIETESWGTSFHWRDIDEPEQKDMTVFGLFKADTEYFNPSPLDHMINFIVEDLAAFRQQLLDDGVEISDIQDEENGRFAWVMDPDGRRIELWQPARQSEE